MRKIGVAILGLGVVGGGVYRVLTDNAEFYQRTQNVDVTVLSVLEPDESKTAALGVPKEKIASNIAEIVCDPDVNLVVETIGGATVARDFVLSALNAGKTVVTSNKELIAKYSHELERAAKRQNAGLYFEASCVGGVPVIRTLTEGLQSNQISSMMGIINGTTNYILTKMSEEDVSYDEALKRAQELGYAESDPVNDVDGFDAAYKLSILASLAFHTKVPYGKVFREGIASLAREDIKYGKELGYAVKLLAIAKQSDRGIEVRVHPAFIKENHPLATVRDCFNAIDITGDSVGEIMLYGKGAGALPTASAVVSDILYAATRSENKYSTFRNNAQAEKDVKFVNDFESAYYLRLTVTDKAGVLSKIAHIFARFDISIVELIQKGEAEGAGDTPLVIVTHKTHEVAVKKAVAAIAALEGLGRVESVLRVVS